MITGGINKKHDLLLCAATGGSPALTYSQLAAEYKRNPGLFSQVRILKLDEWVGIPMDHPATCETYLQNHLLRPLNIDSSRYTGFESDPQDPELECGRIREIVRKEGPVDICILGLGMNGHLALNEPSESLHPGCHIAKLSEISRTHTMLDELRKKPSFGLTLGMADILGSRLILILIQGKQKRTIVKEFLSERITCSLPASFLWLHPNAVCLIDKDALEDTNVNPEN